MALRKGLKWLATFLHGEGLAGGPSRDHCVLVGSMSIGRQASCWYETGGSTLASQKGVKSWGEVGGFLIRFMEKYICFNQVGEGLEKKSRIPWSVWVVAWRHRVCFLILDSPLVLMEVCIIVWCGGGSGIGKGPGCWRWRRVKPRNWNIDLVCSFLAAAILLRTAGS